MLSMAVRPDRRRAARDRRVRHGKDVRRGVQHETLAASDVPRGRRRIRQPADRSDVERVGREHAEHALPGRKDGGTRRRRRPEAEIEVGVRISRRAQCRRPAVDGRRPRLRRNAKRHRVRAQRRDRMRALGVSGRCRGARGDHRSLGSDGGRHVAFVGDRAANVYALDAATGALIWKSHVDDHPFARVTASPTFHDGRLYVGVASGEETAGAVAEYECCTFRGSLVVLDAANGSRVWKTYTIEEPQRRAKNRIGTQQWGPSGAPIWSSPAIDVQKNAVYVTTGNNYSGPATDRSDAFVAFDLTSGKILWSRQMTASDDWNTACRLTDQTNCTNKDAPDFDFASPPILVSLPNGRRAIVAGQKSGVVHALDPDRDGEILWQDTSGQGRNQRRRAVGLGGRRIQRLRRAFRSWVASPSPTARRRCPIRKQVAGCSRSISIPASASGRPPPPRACRTRDRCSPAQSAAVSAIPGVVFSGAIDGHLRAYSTDTRFDLWDVDTVQTYKTANGVPGRGGSLNVAGPAISGGTLIINSGYVQNGMPGNVLLAFTVDGKIETTDASAPGHESPLPSTRHSKTCPLQHSSRHRCN